DTLGGSGVPTERWTSPKARPLEGGPSPSGEAGRVGGERRGDETSSHDAAEGSPVHPSSTSTTRCRSGGGIVRPRALAVLRLIASSNLVGCSIGRSPGLA